MIQALVGATGAAL